MKRWTNGLPGATKRLGAKMALRGLAASQPRMRADTHDGPEQIAPLQRPDTLMQLSRSLISEVHLVPHGRAIHLAQSRHARRLARCLLSGVKRTWPSDGVRSANDPKRTFCAIGGELFRASITSTLTVANIAELHHETLDSGFPRERRFCCVIPCVCGRQDYRSGPRRFRRWFRMEAGGGYPPESRLLGTSCPGA